MGSGKRFVGVLLLAVLVVGGCVGGGGDDSDDTSIETWKGTQAQIVASLYESGQLGPKAEVLASMEQWAAKNAPVDHRTGLPDEEGARFFNPPPPEGDGAIRPYGELTGPEKRALTLWIEEKAQGYPAAREALNKAYRERQLEGD